MVSIKVLVATVIIGSAVSVSSTVAVTHYFAPPPVVQTACDKAPSATDVSRSVLRIVPDMKTLTTRPM
jgi:hypothetical protein